jgi:redox-sensitive bicupin YhaK (pirin superfamily)
VTERQQRPTVSSVSNLEPDPCETRAAGGGVAVATPDRLLLEAREVPLGGPRAMLVRRTLPHRQRRTVGAWCFADHYGPDDVAAGAAMQVPPHPHTGLQTVTWLLSGDVLHRDSLGSQQVVRPGELNLMTAGHGIAHAEDSVPGDGTNLHGVQLWVALPDAHREQPAHFEHHADLPVLVDGDVSTVVIMGELAGERSAALAYTPLLGAEVTIGPGGSARLPLEPDFEHAVLSLDGAAFVQGEGVPRSALAYLGRGSRELALSSSDGARVLLLGGVPFGEELVMWWNFVGRDHDEIATAREDWEAGRRFPPVVDRPGERLPAPALPLTRLKPRPSTPA